MTVKIYQFGQEVGGTNSGVGASIPASASYGPEQTFENAIAAQATLTFDNATKSITIRNTHDTASLQVSFDTGATWIDFGPYAAETLAASVYSLLVRATVPVEPSSYEITGILTS